MKNWLKENAYYAVIGTPIAIFILVIILLAQLVGMVCGGES